MEIVVPVSSNCWIYNFCARYHTLTVMIPMLLIFNLILLNKHSGSTVNRHLKRVIFNRWSHLTFLRWLRPWPIVGLSFGQDAGADGSFKRF